jgi:hypothetical protein
MCGNIEKGAAFTFETAPYLTPETSRLGRTFLYFPGNFFEGDVSDNK